MDNHPKPKYFATLSKKMLISHSEGNQASRWFYFITGKGTAFFTVPKRYRINWGLMCYMYVALPLNNSPHHCLFPTFTDGGTIYSFAKSWSRTCGPKF